MRIWLILLSFVGLCHAEAGVCVGADPCKACRDCSACRYCDPKNPKGGSCGVLRDQRAAERERAARKREAKDGPRVLLR